MTPRANRLNQVYLWLAGILQRPEAFGLDSSIPQPLADALETMMRTLGQAIDEESRPTPEPEEDLEVELSQDADQVVSNVC